MTAVIVEHEDIRTCPTSPDELFVWRYPVLGWAWDDEAGEGAYIVDATSSQLGINRLTSLVRLSDGTALAGVFHANEVPDDFAEEKAQFLRNFGSWYRRMEAA
jgi:hypothetical protein